MDWVANLVLGPPHTYGELVLGYWPTVADPALRLVLPASGACLLAGLIWAALRRERAVAWFLLPVILAHLQPLGMALLGFAPTGTGILILVVIYIVAEISLILLAVTYCRRARIASLLIGWFCLVYGALPVYYLVLALSSI